MAEEKPLHQKLFDEPFRFEFFQAVRLLEKIYPEKRAVGGDAMPFDEIVRFRSNVSFDFPASQIDRLIETTDGDEQTLEMFINFMGMIGTSGVLPMPYTELVASRARYRDTSMWAFLDMYTHRMVSMFFRAWGKYRFPIGYERGHDRFTGYLFDFVGLGSDGLRGRMSLEDEALLPYSGLIAQKPHSATALANILGDYFGVSAKVTQFFGQWLDLDQESITNLGKVNSSLSRTAIIGTRIWEQQSKFRLILGPMNFKQFRGFLPNGTASAPMRSIIRFMTGLEFDFDVRLILEKEEVPSCILTTRARRRPMLGWSSWLKSEPFEEDDRQVILQT